MDSLCNYMHHQQLLESDSLFRKTINLAVKLDSIDIAWYQLSNQMDYLNNLKAQPDKAFREYHNLNKKTKRTKDANILAKVYLNFGNSYFFKGSSSDAIRYYERPSIKCNISEYYQSTLSSLWLWDRCGRNKSFVAASSLST